jgi:hypothetical protein
MLLSFGLGASSAAAAEPPEFDSTLSLTGGCGTSPADPVADPGCPEKKPPKPFTKAQGIAIDSFGDEYVASYGAEEGKQGRIDAFSPEGIYITEVKDELGPKDLAVDSKGILYTIDQSPGHNAELARYKPIAYEPAKEEIEYGPRELIVEEPGPSTAGIAINQNDHVFVDWGASIKEYSSAAEGNELKETITSEEIKSSNFAAVDAKRGRLYTTGCREGSSKCVVLVFNLSKPFELLEEIVGPEGHVSKEGFHSTKGWISIAVDEETGDFFVGDLEVTNKVYQFNEDYEPLSTLTLPTTLFEGGEAMQIAVSNAPEGTKNHRYLFVPSLKGRALAFAPPKCQAPIVEGAVATGIAENEAELQALVKPRGCATAYIFEYLTQQEYEEAGNSFTGAQIAGEGTIQPVEQEAKVKAAIDGLSPGTEYRFRIVADNFFEGVGGEDEEEATFTTYNDAPIVKECPEAVRNTYSALLPDCRAYELVTPADTNGRPPRGVGFVGDKFNTMEASPGGEAVSFLTEGGTIPSLGGSGAFNGSPYRSTRSSSGWGTVNAGPSGAEASLPSPGSTSPDQGYAFWIAEGVGSAVVEGKDTHYVRYPDGRSALVGRGSEGTDPEAEGKLITEGGSHIIFKGSGQVQLEPNAPPVGTIAIYDRTSDEVTHVVSLLPGDETPKAGENAAYKYASADGKGVAFTIGSTLYLRVANTTTYKIGTGVEFAGVSEEGKRIFYVESGNLLAFDTASEEVIPFTEVGNATPVNVSTDGTRAYFVSTTAIAEAGPNPNGAFAINGQQNLYLSEEGTIRFVATVTERDVEGKEEVNIGHMEGLGLWTAAFETAYVRLSIDSSRTNVDGSDLLFQSEANLNGYEHKDSSQIYRFDSIDNRLHCISCTPTGAAATGSANLESIAPTQGSPEPFNASGFVPNLRSDGKRAFFQSTEALVSGDNDGVQDVYEWEEQGVGSCTRPGGCVYLVSSGRSEKNNYLYGISASGDDVFFTTSDVLTGGDDNTQSIYDARVGGGFPEESERPCEGEGCKPDLTPPPPLAPPASDSIGPPGNVAPATTKPCPKGKHKVKRHGKLVCVKKKHHTNRKGAGR